MHSCFEVKKEIKKKTLHMSFSAAQLRNRTLLGFAENLNAEKQNTCNAPVPGCGMYLLTSSQCGA